MKQLLTVMAILLFAGLTQGFKPLNKTSQNITSSNTPEFNYAKFMSSLWVNPSQTSIKSITPKKLIDARFNIDNRWNVNVRIDYIALIGVGGQLEYATGDFPVEPFDQAIATTPYSNSPTMHVGITVLGPAEDPTATRNIYLHNRIGYYCQTISGSGEVIFNNIQLEAGDLGNVLVTDLNVCP